MKDIIANRWISLLIATVSLIFLAACSELRDPIPVSSVSSIEVHPAGWTTVSSPDFHGQTIRKENWDMRSCRTCHAPTYTGGTSGKSCTTCHQKAGGPENCTTCHGSTNPAPPRDLSRNTAHTDRGVGAHQPHVVESLVFAAIACSECHKVPSTVYVSGHVDTQAPAEILFADSLASRITNIPGGYFYSATLPRVIPSPSYDAQALKCSNTYCHGTFKNGNPSNAPVWNDPSSTQAPLTGQAACGTCHGDVTKSTLAERALPRTSARGGTHPDFLLCNACHGEVIDANLKFINPSKHINGKLNVFDQERSF